MTFCFVYAPPIICYKQFLFKHLLWIVGVSKIEKPVLGVTKLKINIYIGHSFPHL